MKRNILHTLWAAAAVLLSACTQEELPLPDTGNATPLAITITDGGYAPAASPDGLQKAITRATESGYRTEFTAGDICGLYIVRNGVIVHNNVKLTASEGPDGSLTWESGETLAGGMADEHYFLYYPYQETIPGTDATATSDAGFFATLISGWKPVADQSDYTQGYSASDLMTATGTAAKAGGKLSLSFAMTHRMALAVIEMPKTVYHFTNETGGAIPDYTVSTAADFTAAEARPYRNSDGTYRYLVNPSQTAPSLTGSYDDGMKEFTLTPNGINASNYKIYRVDGAQTVEKSYSLQIGDYLCKNTDGSWYIIPTAEDPGSECIGIVFYAGHHPNDKSDYSSTGIGSEECHGYAVALHDAKNDSYCIWGVYNKVLACYPTDGDGNALNNYSNPDIDWNGYGWTQKIITAAGGKESLNATEQSGYPATYYAVVDYENKVKAPTNSSGWFLPSIGQMWSVYQQRGLLTSAGGSNLRSDDYWSSSEYCSLPAYYALYVRVSDDYVYYDLKYDRICYVRAVLAF